MVEIEPKYTIDDIKLSSSLKKTLKDNGITLEKLASELVPGDLQKYKGFGQKIELSVLQQARELYFA